MRVWCFVDGSVFWKQTLQSPHRRLPQEKLALWGVVSLSLFLRHSERPIASDDEEQGVLHYGGHGVAKSMGEHENRRQRSRCTRPTLLACFSYSATSFSAAASSPWTASSSVLWKSESKTSSSSGNTHVREYENKAHEHIPAGPMKSTSSSCSSSSSASSAANSASAASILYPMFQAASTSAGTEKTSLFPAVLRLERRRTSVSPPSSDIVTELLVQGEASCCYSCRMELLLLY